MKRTLVEVFTDFGLSEGALDLIKAEDKRQLHKWGEQSHRASEWLMFLTEEVGELSEAISEWWFREGTLEQIEHEAVQAATLAIKIAQMARETRWKKRGGDTDG